MIDVVIYPSVCSAFFFFILDCTLALHVQQHMESVLAFSFLDLKISFRIYGLGAGQTFHLLKLLMDFFQAICAFCKLLDTPFDHRSCRYMAIAFIL